MEKFVFSAHSTAWIKSKNIYEMPLKYTVGKFIFVLPDVTILLRYDTKYIDNLKLKSS